jgi:ubiquinone/menaquinone biosynthesis C-methylase UbiE
MDEKLLEKARARDYEPKEIRLAPAEEIPFPAQTFDAFFMGEVLEHLERPHKAVEEAFRILRHGAFGIITTPLKVEAYSFQLGRFHGQSSHHKQEFDTREMKEMLNIPGIKIEGISLVSQNPSRWYRLIMVVEVIKE